MRSCHYFARSVLLILLPLFCFALSCSDDSSPTGTGGGGGDEEPEGVWYVDIDATGGADGSSWENAFTAVQDAVDAASDGEQVWVAGGTYTSPNSADPNVPVIAMKKKVDIYGGFSGTEDELAQRDYHSNLTILDGEMSAYHVVTGADTARLDGFTVTHGNAVGEAQNEYGRGGGMLNHEVSPTVENCIFTGNTARNGGGMYNYNCSARISGCSFNFNYTTKSNSTADGGGGMYNSYSNVQVIGCSFNNNTTARSGGGLADMRSSSVIDSCSFNSNTAGYYGGGIYVDGYGTFSDPDITNCSISNCTADYGGGIGNNFSDSFISNCVVSGNTASQTGGGIYFDSSNSRLTDCIISGNSAEYSGGGILTYAYSEHDSAPEIKNCMIRGNTASADGAGIYNYENNPEIILCTITGNVASNRGGGIFNRNSVPVIMNIISWGNDAASGPEIYDYLGSSPVVTYSDVQGGYAGTGNINQDPLWVTGPDGNYYLSQTACGQASDSPCLNAGSTTAEALGMVDYTTRTDGGPDTGIVDIGFHY